MPEKCSVQSLQLINQSDCPGNPDFLLFSAFFTGTFPSIPGLPVRHAGSVLLRFFGQVGRIPVCGMAVMLRNLPEKMGDIRCPGRLHMIMLNLGRFIVKRPTISAPVIQNGLSQFSVDGNAPEIQRREDMQHTVMQHACHACAFAEYLNLFLDRPVETVNTAANPADPESGPLGSVQVRECPAHSIRHGCGKEGSA